jgi:hypothetical protein
MSSTGSRDELRDEGHDGEDEDGGEELNKAAAMILIDGGDDLDEARGRARGMTMTRSNGWIHDDMEELLKAASGCGRVSMGLGEEPALIYVLEMVLSAKIVKRARECSLLHLSHVRSRHSISGTAGCKTLTRLEGRLTGLVLIMVRR